MSMAFPTAVTVSVSLPSSSNHVLPAYPQNQTNPIINLNFNTRKSMAVASPRSSSSSPCFRVSYRFSGGAAEDEEGDEEAEDCSFDEAVILFNTRQYYKCHDFLESLWNNAQDPSRTLIHGILQCAVGFHHLFNQNHRGAMMELGEGLCKLRKFNFKSGPFYEFEREISAALDFIYQTQIELAACTEDLCVTMDRSERSYQLLGGYGAGQLLYTLQSEPNETTVNIVFSPHTHTETEPPKVKVKLPTLNATTQHLLAACDYW